MPVRKKCFPPLLGRHDSKINKNASQKSIISSYGSDLSNMQNTTIEVPFFNHQESINGLFSNHLNNAFIKSETKQMDMSERHTHEELDLEVGNVHDDGTCIDVTSTHILHSWIDYSRLKKSLGESVMRWKVEPQLAGLSKKNKSAICGSIVSVTVEPHYSSVDADEDIPKLTNQSLVTAFENSLHRLKVGKRKRDTTPLPVSHPIPMCPQNPIDVEQTTSPPLVTKLSLKTVVSTRSSFSLGNLFSGKREIKIKAEPIQEIPTYPLPRDLIDDESTQPAIFPEPTNDVEIPEAPRHSSRRKRTRKSPKPGPASKITKSSPITQTECFVNQETTVPVSQDVVSKESPSKATVPLLECCSKCNSECDKQSQTVFGVDLRLCNPCSRWLTSFLKSLSALHQTACILPIPCYQLQQQQQKRISKDKTSTAATHPPIPFCKQCKFQSFVALIGSNAILKSKNIKRDVPKDAQNILKSIDSKIDVMRRDELIQEARVHRCEEYAHQLAMRRRGAFLQTIPMTSTTQEEFRKIKISSRENRLRETILALKAAGDGGPLAGQVQLDIDKELLKPIAFRSVKNFVCSLCDIPGHCLNATGTTDIKAFEPSGMFHYEVTETSICESCVRHYQELLQKPPPQIRCESRVDFSDEEDQDGSSPGPVWRSECPPGLRCEPCFYHECTKRLPESVVLAPLECSALCSVKPMKMIESNVNTLPLLKRYRPTRAWEANICCQVCDTRLEQMIHLQNLPMIGGIADLRDEKELLLHFYKLLVPQEETILLCEYCLWTFIAGVKKAKGLPDVHCKRGGACNLLQCSVCLTKFCMDFLPPDEVLPVPSWVREAMQAALAPLKEEAAAPESCQMESSITEPPHLEKSISESSPFEKSIAEPLQMEVSIAEDQRSETNIVEPPLLMKSMPEVPQTERSITNSSSAIKLITNSQISVPEKINEACQADKIISEPRLPETSVTEPHQLEKSSSREIQKPEAPSNPQKIRMKLPSNYAGKSHLLANVKVENVLKEPCPPTFNKTQSSDEDDGALDDGDSDYQEKFDNHLGNSSQSRSRGMRGRGRGRGGRGRVRSRGLGRSVPSSTKVAFTNVSVRGRQRKLSTRLADDDDLYLQSPPKVSGPRMKTLPKKEDSPNKQKEDQEYPDFGSGLRNGENIPPMPIHGRGRRIKQATFPLPSHSNNVYIPQIPKPPPPGVSVPSVIPVAPVAVSRLSKTPPPLPHIDSEEESNANPSEKGAPSSDDDGSEKVVMPSQETVADKMDPTRVRLSSQSTDSNMCVGCKSCGNTLSCVSCKDAYHFYCIERLFRPQKKDYFVCRKCTRCQMCRKPDSCELHCSVCSTFYHSTCLQEYPPASVLGQPYWLCPDCAQCKKCHRTYSNNGKRPQTNIEWSTQSDICSDCNQATLTNESCPECEKVSRAGKDVFQCVSCSKFVHRSCARLNKDEDDLLSDGTVKSDGITFRCSLCSQMNHCTVSFTTPNNSVKPSALDRTREASHQQKQSTVPTNNGSRSSQNTFK